jgi:hypothetical protein
MSEKIFNYEEILLEAHANQESIDFEFAELLRLQLRGIASSHVSSATWDVLQKLKYISDLVRCCEKFNERQSIAHAMQDLSEGQRDTPMSDALTDVSIAGLMYLVECSSSDRLAKARASQRKSKLLEAIQRVLDLRK